MTVSVQAEDFDVAKELQALEKNGTRAGAIASFLGIVRDVPLTLEHYPGMTERVMTDLYNQATSRFDLLGARLIHRYGSLNPGDQIVLALAAARHRKAAIEAIDFMMDTLKTTAPFWKQEGETWVKQRTDDLNAAKTWQKG